MSETENALESLPSPWEPKDVQSVTEMKTGAKTGQNGSRVIEFTVYHKPMGAPRMTQRDKWKKRPCVEAYHAFKDAIRRDCPPLPATSEIESLSWVAYFQRTKKSKTHVNDLHRVKPDRDNIDKSVLDALFTDDAGIASGSIEKRWGVEDKLVVTIALTAIA